MEDIFPLPFNNMPAKNRNHSIPVMSNGISGLTRKSNLSRWTTVVTLVRGYACAHFQLWKLINACDMANGANASNHHTDVWIPLRASCGTHWNPCYKRHSEFSTQQSSQNAQHAFFKELSSMATHGGLGEIDRDRDSVGLSGLCKECWSVNDVCASARAQAQCGSSLRRTARHGTSLTPHCGTKCHSTANETPLAHGDNWPMTDKLFMGHRRLVGVKQCGIKWAPEIGLTLGSTF